MKRNNNIAKVYGLTANGSPFEFNAIVKFKRLDFNRSPKFLKRLKHALFCLENRTNDGRVISLWRDGEKVF